MDLLKNMFFGAFLFIDAVIYSLIRYIYQIFMALAELNLFDESDYMSIVNRIYIILGVVMLFVLAYSLLKVVINPDDFAKKDNSVPGLIKNVIISLIIIVILPTVFTVAFNVQKAVFNTDIIPKVILGVDTMSSGMGNKIKKNGGNDIAINTFKAFFQPNEGKNSDDIMNNEQVFGFGGTSLTDAYKDVESGGSFFQFVPFSDAVNNGDINYMVIISTIVGAILLLVLASYCIDLGVRVIKLMFYQIIAPIPVVARIVPGDKGKKVFGDWMKQTISTFLDVFVRVGVMYLGVYIIRLIVEKFSPVGVTSVFEGLGITQTFLAIAILIVGVILFVRQAPKLIKDLFGFDMGGNLNPISNLLGIGATLGGGVTTGVRNFAKTFKKNPTIKGFMGAAASSLAGFGSGAVRGAYGARNAKNLKDMQNAANTAIQGAEKARDKRSAYKASHGGTIGVIGGHKNDMFDLIKTWAGMDNGLAELQAEQEVYKEGMSFKKELFDLVADNQSVAAYQGLKKAAEEKDLAKYTANLQLNGAGQVEDIATRTVIADKDGNTFTSLDAAAISMKTEEIEKYKTAADLASVRAIHEKILSGDGRFTAQLEKYKVFKQQHSDNALVASLADLSDIDATQLSMISAALNSNDFTQIDNAKKTLEAADGSVLANDKKFKINNGDVQVKISKKIQEKKASENK